MDKVKRRIMSEGLIEENAMNQDLWRQKIAMRRGKLTAI